jgi:rhodanese-related sulfurtransferase
VASFTADEAELSPARVSELLSADEIQLIDVRESYVWEAGRIAGARHIELERLSSEAESIDRERPVVFHCQMGSRSAMATQAFLASGWTAYNMQGGIKAWADGGLPLEPEDGIVADH